MISSRSSATSARAVQFASRWAILLAPFVKCAPMQRGDCAVPTGEQGALDGVERQFVSMLRFDPTTDQVAPSSARLVWCGDSAVGAPAPVILAAL